MKKVLKKSFFNKSAIHVAKELLGKYIICTTGDDQVSLMITETEAYEGPEDLASHASKGRTPRTEVMYGDAGTIYIYLIYGMHYMINIVTGEKEYPAAVLIRGTKEVRGPGRLTKLLKIDKRLNNLQAIPENGLWFEDRGHKVIEQRIKQTARVGVNYAGPIWANKEYRFIYEV